MYSLAIGCLFRNESHSIVEWLEHYLFHGVEHFYLINDLSDDSSCQLIQPYIDRGLITLFNANWDRYLGRQRDMYNHYILPLISQTKWLLLVDMDEYVWSPKHLDVRLMLEECFNIGQIQIDHTLFGSSGHELQPKTIVGDFIFRSKERPTKEPGNRKYIIQTKFGFSSLNIHHATFNDVTLEKDKFTLLGDPYFRMNHYSCQSLEFWKTVKCVRGDGDEWRQRTFADFNDIDVNDEKDDGLLQQNLPVYEKMGLLLE